MAQKNNNKMNISYTIRAIDKFTDTHERLERQLEALERQAAQLDAIDPDINVDVDSGAALAQLQAVNNAVDRLPWYKRVWIHIQGVNKKHRDRVDKLATQLRNMDEILMQMAQGLIWLLLPALGPMLAAAGGGAGALAAQLIGATAGLGAFAMVAVPTIGYLKEIDGEVKRGSSAWKKLSQGTRDALTALDTLRASWRNMQKTFREPTLEVFAIALKGANTGLKMFLPTVESSITAMKNLAEAFNANLASDDVKAIFEWLGTTAGGYLEDLMKTLGNFLVGFMNMMVAFDPLTQKFSDGFLRMSEKFREWSSTLDTNQGFQRFMQYAAEQGPILLSFLGQLITFLTQLFVAMAPVGEQIMKAVQWFLEWAEAGLKNNEWIGKLIALFMVWRAVLGIFMPIILQVVRVFQTLWPIVTKVWSWVGKLQGAFVRILPWITRVAVFIATLHPVIKIIIAVVAVLASVIYKNWDSIWKWTKDTYAKVANWISQKWDEAGEVIEGVKLWVQVVSKGFQLMYQGVRTKLTEIYNTIKSKWDQAKSFLKGIDLKSIGSNIIKGLVRGISSVDVAGAVRSIAGKIKSAFTNFFKIKSPSRLMQKDVGRWITLGVIDGMLAMSSKAESQAAVVANAIKRPFEEMNKDYTFTAVGDARTRYSSAMQGATAAQQGPQNSKPIYITNVMEMDGYEIARAQAPYIDAMQSNEVKLSTFMKGDKR